MHNPTLKAHLEILRIDHWIKNVFVLPGVIVAIAFGNVSLTLNLALNIVLGLISICIVASSYYTLNEILDAPFDITHPKKKFRPVPSGKVYIQIGIAQWLILGCLGILLGSYIKTQLGYTLIALWIMGCFYNIPPVRTKDVPYLDVLSEALNNPLRFLSGWYIVDIGSVPPASLLLSYYFIGAYFMGIKRFAEFREINDQKVAAAYRKSFQHYNEQKLLTSIIFYGSSAMLFLGAFMMRWRLELIISYPFIAFVMAIYFDIAFKNNSPAQAPEKLYSEPRLMIAISVSALAFIILFFVDIPLLHQIIGIK